MSRILFLIPVRGGSKGLPGKNLRTVCGKSLLARAVESATAAVAALVHDQCQVIVSTEDTQLADEAIRSGASVPFLRPSALATDDTATIDVLLQALDNLGEAGHEFDIVVLVQATTPLRSASDILDALRHFDESTGKDAVVSVTPAHHPPQWLFHIENGRLEPLLDDWWIPQRQAAADCFMLNGAIYIATPEWLRTEGSFLVPGKTRPFIMPQDRSVDVDTEIDLKLADLLAKQERAVARPNLSPMPKVIEIDQNWVGADNPTFVIAEAGVNHNGNVNTAIELIKAAKHAGANCVKFQTFKAERVAVPTAPKAKYQLRSTDSDESQVEMLRSLELSESDHMQLIDACKQHAISFMSTPYSIEDVDLLEGLGVPAYKVASALLVEPHFLRHLAKTRKPIILSTGLATLKEVSEAVEALRLAGNERVIVLQCTTNYPSDIRDTNLRAMTAMREALGTLVGYSDHTESDLACIAAVARGACVIEKHLTLDRTMPGPDHACSSEPGELARLIERIRAVEAALGSEEKRPTAAELENSVGMRRSIVTTRAIRKGSVISGDDLTTKRPATGLSPQLWDVVLGRRAVTDIAADTILTLEMCHEESEPENS